MDAKLAEIVRAAAAQARRKAQAFNAQAFNAQAFDGTSSRDALPWAVIEAFDADVRGHVERDRRIEEERDRVLITAVNFAETRPEDGAEEIEAARSALIDAIDYLEQAVLRFGIVNRQGAKLGYGEAGQSVTARR
ncbi:hypothetical protein [Methylobacterium sp. 77]|uniref:hypothetical protein n=1 Tax=Methylobacterium sp. 77 TaxID=1101192 RepID=UPI000372CE8D|nr:hypothetical protein [Methylobacterium sp. 77]